MIDADSRTTRDGLTGLTKAGLWYIYSATPSFWALVARGFGLRVEPSDWRAETLESAEERARRAVKFVPIPLGVTAAVLLLAAWWRPALDSFLTALADEGFTALVLARPIQALGHDAGEFTAVALVTVAVWVLSLASVLLSFAPIWLAFRHQMHAASSVVAVALASEVAGPAMAEAVPVEYPRVRYAMGMLQGRQVRMRNARRTA